MNFYQLLASTEKLVPVQDAVAAAHRKNAGDLISFVDKVMAEHPQINLLIGNNPLQVMKMNHRHHCSFMQTVFCLNDFKLLARTVVWVYRAYHQHGFSFDYFPIELNTWIKAVESSPDADLMRPVIAIYRWMLDAHDTFSALALEKSIPDLAIQTDWVATKEGFKNFLLEGNHRDCLRLVKEKVTDKNKVPDFFLQVIQPVMYEIGWLWETNRISVAQEHAASAIIGRVMTAINALDFARPVLNGCVVVTSAPDDYHEIGAWMIADLLDQHGYMVKYLGANTPAVDLIKLLKDSRADVLAVSITMPFNCPSARDLIRQTRAEADLKSLKIIVGGRCLNENPELWETLGADACARDALAAADKIAEWLPQ